MRTIGSREESVEGEVFVVASRNAFVLLYRRATFAPLYVIASLLERLSAWTSIAKKMLL
jgi:hypothetical protein